MVQLNRLVKDGYLPYELVPSFNTRSLERSLPAITPGLGNYSKTESRCCQYSIPKIKNHRRILSIPNPLHQLRLFNVISANWTEIDTYINSSDLSITKPIIKEFSKRALTRKVDFKELPLYKALNSTSSRYLLKVDISRYYPSIYTHSIPWALHTKPVAKSNHSTTLLGNYLDKMVQRTQDRQTMGLPIGPDSSYVISEIIGTAIDKRLQEELGQLQGFRYIDDYYLYFPTSAGAEYALSKFHIILREYELELNPIKTEIIYLPDRLETKWVTEFRYGDIRRDSWQAQRSDLINYFSKAFELCHKYPNDYVLKYAISKIKGLAVFQPNWELYESLLLKSFVSEPSVLPIITQIFNTYDIAGWVTAKDKIQKAITEVILYHSKYNNGHEVTWAMCLSKTLNIEITPQAASEICNMSDNLTILVALDLYNRGLIPNGFSTANWTSLMKAEELYSENWLVAYEAIMQNWLPSLDNSDYISNDDFFSVLKANDVRFYEDIGVGITTDPRNINPDCIEEPDEPELPEDEGLHAYA